MPWFKVDDKFHSHPKVMELTTGAVGLWTLAGSWCADYLTDGRIKRGQLRRLGGDDEQAAELVKAGLWIEVDDGYQFRDWHDYQPTRESVLTKKEQDAERKRKGREEQRRKRKEVRMESERTHSGQGAESSGPEPEPVPVSPNGDTQCATADADRADVDASDDAFELIPAAHAGPSVRDLFAQFYDAYPRKRDKARAETAFTKAVQQKRIDPQRIIDAARRMAADPNLPEASLVPHAATWLNAERWDDPPYEPRTGRTNAQDRRAQQVVDLVARNLPDPNQDPRGEVEP